MDQRGRVWSATAAFCRSLTRGDLSSDTFLSFYRTCTSKQRLALWEGLTQLCPPQVFSSSWVWRYEQPAITDPFLFLNIGLFNNLIAELITLSLEGGILPNRPLNRLPTTLVFFLLKSKVLPNLKKYYRQVLLYEGNIVLLNEVVFWVHYQQILHYSRNWLDFLWGTKMFSNINLLQVIFIPKV